MNEMSRLTTKDPMESLSLLENAAPESRGILNHKDPLLSKMYKLLRESDRARNLLQCDESSAEWSLDCLLHMPGELGEIMRQVTLSYGWRLAGGYDIVVPALIESPHFFLKTILQGVNGAEEIAEKSNEKMKKLADEWRSALPVEKREEFDRILTLGKQFSRMRDARGLSTDLEGVGLCRRGLLEAGRRLEEKGIIHKREHITVATKREAIALLTGDLGRLRSSSSNGSSIGPVEVPTADVLQQRFEHIQNADPSLVPRGLGSPPDPTPELPESMASVRRTMDALDSSLIRGTWGEGNNHDDDDSSKSSDRVTGVPASMGKVTGPVRRILSDQDLRQVQQGDILVTYSSSASFNIVLGLCAGIVTDYGGMLSHAAIVAREYGIPAGTLLYSNWELFGSLFSHVPM